MNAENKGSFSIDEFCTWAGIGRTLVYKEIERGRIKTKKVGRRTIIPVGHAMDWLTALDDGAPGNATKVTQD